MNTIEEVRAYFERDRFATENNCYIEEIGDNYAKCSMTLSDRHKNAMGNLMGGATFTLADFTFAVATNWKEPCCVSINSNISFAGKCKGTKLIAEAHCLKSGRSACFYHIEIHDDLGNLVATVEITGFVLSK